MSEHAIEMSVTVPSFSTDTVTFQLESLSQLVGEEPLPLPFPLLLLPLLGPLGFPLLGPLGLPLLGLPLPPLPPLLEQLGLPLPPLLGPLGLPLPPLLGVDSSSQDGAALLVDGDTDSDGDADGDADDEGDADVNGDIEGD